VGVPIHGEVGPVRVRAATRLRMTPRARGVALQHANGRSFRNALMGPGVLQDMKCLAEPEKHETCLFGRRFIDRNRGPFGGIAARRPRAKPRCTWDGTQSGI